MSSVHPSASIIGYPRIGKNRELKKAVEAYWAGTITHHELSQVAADVQRKTYTQLREQGLTQDWAIPADFSYYDQVLDVTRLLTAVPARLQSVLDNRGLINLDAYFALARGTENSAPLELTKWFDTNYHYLVPEIGSTAAFTVNTEAIDELLDTARQASVAARLSLVGPLTYLLLAKAEDGSAESFSPLNRLDDVLDAYIQVQEHLYNKGIEWVQFNEPALCADHQDVIDLPQLVEATYKRLASHHKRPNILVTSSYGSLRDNLAPLVSSGIEALHLDLVSGHYSPEDFALFADDTAPTLVAGIVNGRNVWRNDLDTSLTRLKNFFAGRLAVSTSTSLQHVPYDVNRETKLNPTLISWLAFAEQKVDEVVALSSALNGAVTTQIQDAFTASRRALATRANATGVNNPCIRERALSINPRNFERPSAEERQIAQQDLGLPLLPTTTIGSFPQTAQIRSLRAQHRKGQLSDTELAAFLKEEIRSVIEYQESIGLDVLVHGEAERNDMVQYFAEHFDGFATTEHGWVQSYGSRCTRPSILWGDVKREGSSTRGQAFTVDWIRYAQSLTTKPVKGMLTGPVTILAWSFVRDDQSREQTANQVALALADEIQDLEDAGIRIIQVDEPALRELLPLRTDQQSEYLSWAVNAFRLATSQVKDSTQIHTHLCYSEFNEIFDSIDALNADVTSIEAARSRLELLTDVPESFIRGIGPGVWDIHSPRIPTVDEIGELIATAARYIDIEQLWINPDCGLKTRGYGETRAALTNIVTANLQAREALLAKA